VRAVVCRTWGEVEQLALEDVPSPEPGRDELLIDVRATVMPDAQA